MIYACLTQLKSLVDRYVIAASHIHRCSRYDKALDSEDSGKELPNTESLDWATSDRPNLLKQASQTYYWNTTNSSRQADSYLWRD
jgi:hypothetical protein